jgi:hypothetical protein
VVSTSDLLGALHVLSSLSSPRAAHAAAQALPDHLEVVDLLRVSDGVQGLALALAAKRPHGQDVRPRHDPHDTASLYR